MKPWTREHGRHATWMTLMIGITVWTLKMVLDHILSSLFVSMLFTGLVSWVISRSTHPSLSTFKYTDDDIWMQRLFYILYLPVAHYLLLLSIPPMYNHGFIVIYVILLSVLAKPEGKLAQFYQELCSASDAWSWIECVYQHMLSILGIPAKRKTALCDSVTTERCVTIVPPPAVSASLTFAAPVVWTVAVGLNPSDHHFRAMDATTGHLLYEQLVPVPKNARESTKCQWCYHPPSSTLVQFCPAEMRVYKLGQRESSSGVFHHVWSHSMESCVVGRSCIVGWSRGTRSAVALSIDERGRLGKEEKISLPAATKVQFVVGETRIYALVCIAYFQQETRPRIHVYEDLDEDEPQTCRVYMLEESTWQFIYLATLPELMSYSVHFTAAIGNRLFLGCHLHKKSNRFQLHISAPCSGFERDIFYSTLDLVPDPPSFSSSASSLESKEEKRRDATTPQLSEIITPDNQLAPVLFHTLHQISGQIEPVHQPANTDHCWIVRSFFGQLSYGPVRLITVPGRTTDSKTGKSSSRIQLDVTQLVSQSSAFTHIWIAQCAIGLQHTRVEFTKTQIRAITTSCFPSEFSSTSPSFFFPILFDYLFIPSVYSAGTSQDSILDPNHTDENPEEKDEKGQDQEEEKDEEEKDHPSDRDDEPATEDQDQAEAQAEAEAAAASNRLSRRSRPISARPW